MVEFNAEVALEQFEKRKALECAKSRTDNSALPAGSPLYYYCWKCCIHLVTLPELHLQRPPRLCDPCKALMEHGLI